MLRPQDNAVRETKRLDGLWAGDLGGVDDQAIGWHGGLAGKTSGRQ